MQLLIFIGVNKTPLSDGFKIHVNRHSMILPDSLTSIINFLLECDYVVVQTLLFCLYRLGRRHGGPPPPPTWRDVVSGGSGGGG